MLRFAVVVLVCVDIVLGNPVAKPSSTVRCGRVHLSVSSLKRAYLELNWIANCDSPKDVKPSVVALYNKDPGSREEFRPLETVFAPNFPSGFYKTQIKFGDPYLPGNWEYSENLTRADPGKHCFPYYIASISEDGKIIDKQCLAIQPTWMNDNRQFLIQQRLDQILIPGTHNSGAYDHSKLPPIIRNYILNQDKLIWTQLVFGIRYLDLRVGYYSNAGFYINHDLVRIMPLKPVLKQIRKFMELTEEIVVVDFHRFPYPSDFSQDLHNLLTSLIYEELGEFAVLRTNFRGKAPSFNELWNQEKRLVIAYSDDTAIQQRPWLWKGVNQYWANTVDTPVLKSYMEAKIKNHGIGENPLWALMAELTPRAKDILYLRNDLRKLADKVNRELTKWFRDEWAQLTVNIVATDYFLGNDLINVAIEEVKS